MQIPFVFFNKFDCGGLTSLFQTELIATTWTWRSIWTTTRSTPLSHTHTRYLYPQRKPQRHSVARMQFFIFDHAFSLDPCSPWSWLYPLPCQPSKAALQCHRLEYLVLYSFNMKRQMRQTHGQSGPNTIYFSCVYFVFILLSKAQSCCPNLVDSNQLYTSSPSLFQTFAVKICPSRPTFPPFPLSQGAHPVHFSEEDRRHYPDPKVWNSEWQKKCWNKIALIEYTLLFLVETSLQGSAG
jgi:hypothetical protein